MVWDTPIKWRVFDMYYKEYKKQAILLRRELRKKIPEIKFYVRCFNDTRGAGIEISPNKPFLLMDHELCERIKKAARDVCPDGYEGEKLEPETEGSISIKTSTVYVKYWEITS